MLKNLSQVLGPAYLRKKLDFGTHEWTKLILLAIAYFFIIGSYSILKPIKTSVFLGLVGIDWQPFSRYISLAVIFPSGLLYSRIVDKYKRHQIFFTIIGIYAVLCIVFTILFADPIHGIKNTTTSPYRIVGWIFEIFMDLYSAIVVSTFWGYANSVSTPNFANKSYGIMTAASRIGGILTTSLALFLLNVVALRTEINIPLLTFIAGIFLFGAIACVYLINNWIPESALHGYEAAYKSDYKTEHSKNKKSAKTGVFEGIRLMLVEPYVLGIFSMVYFFEIITILFDFQMQALMCTELHNDIGAMVNFGYWNTIAFQFVGLLLAIFGTSTLLEKIGTLKCLMIMPIGLIILSLSTLIYPTLSTIFIVMVLLRGLNYGFNVPVRETLYIPTVKNIQFKAKVWIDSFGRTLSKTSGSAINSMYASLAPQVLLVADSACAIGISFAFAGVSFLVGRKYTKTIKNNAVIGTEEEITQERTD
jgi:AAA family ATP:ADP antiporter